MDLPPSFTIRESSHRIHNPLTSEKLAPGGMMLIGEPYWRREPPDQATVEGCHATSRDEWLPLPELIESFGGFGCDVVEMVLADSDS